MPSKSRTPGRGPNDPARRVHRCGFGASLLGVLCNGFEHVCDRQALLESGLAGKGHASSGLPLYPC
jgi:hypothetical protein